MPPELLVSLILTATILTTITAHLLQSFATLQSSLGERKKGKKKKHTTNTNKTQFSSWPSSRLLPHPFARAWSWQAGLPQPRICILFSRQCRHAGLAETGVYKVMPSNCFTWLCSLWSPSFFKLLFPTTSFLIANCTTVYLCILHTHRKASAKTSTPKKSSWVNWGRLQDLLRNEAH